MELREALAPIALLARESAILTTMSAVGDWPAEHDHPLVFHFMPSSMGQGSSLALGLALAKPERSVVALNGDGCTLMNLGSLVTIGKVRPANLTLVVLDNGIYEVTGGQPHGGRGSVDYLGFARAAGIESGYEFADANQWAGQAAELVQAQGPTFIRLVIEPRFGRSTPKPPRTMPEQIDRLRTALGA